MDVKWYRYDTIDSTSSEARRLLQSGALTPPAVVLAQAQTAGRGRQGKSFYSPGKAGIYMSMVVDFPQEASSAALLTIRAGVAVSDAIREETGIETGIKWVNDIFLDGRKVCGILTESVLQEGKRRAILGIGINVTTESFPPELRSTAGALGLLGAERMDSLPAAVLTHILRRISDGDDRDVLEEYKKRSVVLDRIVSYERDGIAYEGRAADIDADGALIVELGDGTFDLLQSGEISLKTWK